MDKRIKQQYHSVSLSTKSEINFWWCADYSGQYTPRADCRLVTDGVSDDCWYYSVGCYVIEITFVYNVC